MQALARIVRAGGESSLSFHGKRTPPPHGLSVRRASGILWSLIFGRREGESVSTMNRKQKKLWDL
jgi:hypothetical protein